MTYKGLKPIINKSTIIDIGANALINPSRIMFQKISNILSIASFVLIVSTLISAFFGYKYVTSEQFKNKMLNQIMGNVSGAMPDLLDKKLPEMTSPHVPMPYKLLK